MNATKHWTETDTKNENDFYNPNNWTTENLIVELKNCLHITKKHLLDELLKRLNE